jgi:hypothetical protein
MDSGVFSSSVVWIFIFTHYVRSLGIDSICFLFVLAPLASIIIVLVLLLLESLLLFFLSSHLFTLFLDVLPDFFESIQVQDDTENQDETTYPRNELGDKVILHSIAKVIGFKNVETEFKSIVVSVAGPHVYNSGVVHLEVDCHTLLDLIGEECVAIFVFSEVAYHVNIHVL